MATVVVYPPSPALSTCSEDLEAILNAAGPISRFPTPPWPKPTTKKETRPVHSRSDSLFDESYSTDSRQETYHRIARLFTQQTTTNQHDNDDEDGEVDSIRQILLRASLPSELLACAYNILLGLDRRQRQSVLQDLKISISSDLLVVSVLSLTMSYIVDHPPNSQFWSEEICRGLWLGAEIDGVVWEILRALDFRLLECFLPERVERSLEEILPRSGADGEIVKAPAVAVGVRRSDVAEDPHVCWSHGQITPDASPPHALPA